MATINVSTGGSISAGISSASSGDTVLVASGTYNERITINKNITVKTTAGAKIRNSGTIVVITGSGATLDGFDIERPKWESARNDLVQIKSSNVTVKNCTVYISNVNSTSAAYSAFAKEKASGILVSGNNATVENCEVWGCGFGVAFPNDTGRNSVVRNCNLHHTIQSPLRINACPSFAPNGRGLLVEGCNLNYSYTEDGIQWLDYPNKGAIDNYGTMIRNCLFIGNAENAVDFKACDRVVVEGCIMTRTEGNNDGMQDGIPCGSWGTIMVGTGSYQRNVIIRNCVVYNSAGGLALNGNYTKAYNNTVLYGNYTHNGSQSGSCGRSSGVVERSGYSNMGLRNNIIGGFTDSLVMAHMASGYDIDYNCYFNGGSGSVMRWREGRKSSTYYNTFSAWKSRLSAKGARGADANSIEVASLAAMNFTSVGSIPTGMPGSYDFSVTPSSPAYQSGGPLTTCTSSGTGTRITVRDATWFCDGHGSSHYNGDTIVVDTTEAVVTDISGDTITLDRSISFTSGDPVYWGATNRPNIGIIDLDSLPPIDPDPGYISASFTADATNVLAGTEINFTDQSSSDTTITAWSWKEDGVEFSTSQNPARTFNAAGTFDISLTVTSSSGNDTLTKSGYIIVSDITADFYADTTSVAEGDIVSFTDTSTASNSITAWSWKEDGVEFSTSQNPTRTFGTAGTYDISLTVTSVDGSDTRTRSGYIVVSTPPSPPIEGEQLTNYDFSSGTIGWTFSTTGTAAFSAASGVAEIDVTTAGTTQLYQYGIEFTVSAEYQFSMTAWCESGTMDVTMRAMDHESPFTSFIREDIVVTTTPQTFTFTDTELTGIANGRVAVFVNSSGVLHIDSVSFSTTSAPNPPVSTPTVAEVTSVACNTSTGNQTITLTSGITPTAAMFIVTAAHSSENPYSGNAMSVGFATAAGSQAAGGYASSDAVGTSYVVRRTRTDACCSLPTFDANTTDQCRFSIVSMATNQIVINVDIAPTNPVQIQVHAFDADSQGVGTVTPSTVDEDTVVAESSMTATPTLLFTWTPGYDTNSFPAGWRSDAKACFGVSDGTNSYAIVKRIKDSQTTTGIVSDTRSGYVAYTDAGYAASAEFSTSGWTMRTKETNGSWNGTFAYLALSFSENSGVVFKDSIPAASGSTTHAIGQVSSYVGAIATTHDSVSSADTKGSWSIGGWDSNLNVSSSSTSENGITTTNEASEYSSSHFVNLLSDSGTAGKAGLATGNSGTSLAVTWTNTDTSSTPNIILWSLLGSAAEATPEAAAADGNITLSATCDAYAGPSEAASVDGSITLSGSCSATGVSSTVVASGSITLSGSCSAGKTTSQTTNVKAYRRSYSVRAARRGQFMPGSSAHEIIEGNQFFSEYDVRTFVVDVSLVNDTIDTVDSSTLYDITGDNNDTVTDTFVTGSASKTTSTTYTTGSVGLLTPGKDYKLQTVWTSTTANTYTDDIFIFCRD